MYKLFLTFRYLTRKAIVVFPILVVWLCVMMMIIVTSFMGGFVDRVLEANRQLMGDVVIDSQSRAGWPLYAELQADLAKMPEVISSTPLIQSYGLINLPRYRANTLVQIIGIDPVGRARLSNFRQTLFRQYTAPMEAVNELQYKLPATGAQLQQTALSQYEQVQSRMEKLSNGEVVTLTSAEAKWRVIAYTAGVLIVLVLLWAMWRWKLLWWWVAALAAVIVVIVASGFWYQTWAKTDKDKQLDFLQDQLTQTRADIEDAERTYEFAMGLGERTTYKDRQALIDALVPREPSFRIPPEAMSVFGSKANAPKEGCIIGIDLFSPQMFPRDRHGRYRHPREFDFVDAWLTAVPVKPSGTLGTTAAQMEHVAIVDSSYSRVYETDSTYVYAPFAMVQRLAAMNAGTDIDDKPVPARCNELEIQVKNSDDAVALRAAKDAINERIAAFAKVHPELDGIDIQAHTWEEKQARYINAVRHEKGMITFILGLMSLVVIVVIFLIFYMIVRDKTRDIGIIKALGGSEEGVAGIFMMYGLFIGLVGGVLGMVTGVEFMWHTNEIHEWFYRMTGIVIWDRSVYLFDRIPDAVNWNEVLIYVGAAIVAGLLGALIPAIVAGIQNPVKAVRFE